jgi:hypothetical protein
MKLITKSHAVTFLGLVLSFGCVLTSVLLANPPAQPLQEGNVALSRRTARARAAMAYKPSGKTARESEIRATLNANHDLLYDAAPFEDVVAFLRDLKLNVVIDPNLDGVLDTDTEVSSNLSKVRLADGLRTMLRDVDATFVVKDGLLLIMSIDDENEPEYLVRRMVDVRDLLDLIQKNQNARKATELRVSSDDAVNKQVEDKEAKSGTVAKPVEPVARKEVVVKTQMTVESQLINTITDIVSSDSWVRNGTGNGEIGCIGGVLVVTNSEKVTEDVLTFVQDLKYQIKNRN